MAKKLMTGNIFKNIPAAKDAEVFETLARGKNFRVERITSRGQTTPAGEWLVQAQDEWVIVLKGEGRLKFKGGSSIVTLKPGEHVFIPANTAHRVEWTSPREKTIWLAVTEV
jgi:cupin 2 domain-containing protein